MHGIVNNNGTADYTYLPSLKKDHDVINWYGDQDSAGELFRPLASSGSYSDYDIRLKERLRCSVLGNSRTFIPRSRNRHMGSFTSPERRQACIMRNFYISMAMLSAF